MLNSKNVNTAQKGFTLIELVVVIVILGILAVTAAPRFINLQADAQTATLQAIKASMETASTLVHSKALIAGNDTAAAVDDESVVVNSSGDTVSLSAGYPISDTAGASSGVPAANWGLLLDLNTNDFTISDGTVATAGIPGVVVVYPAGNDAPTAFPAILDAPTSLESNCFAYYTETTVATTQPVMDVVPCL